MIATSEKELFLKYLQLMDIEKLDLILDDRISYFGTYKKIFLEKLQFIFNEYHLSELKTVPVIKQHQKYNNIYYFKLPDFDINIKFIIEEKYNKIIRIFNKKTINSKQEAYDMDPFEMYFGIDERIGFEPSPEYLILLHQCQKAYEKLENQEDMVLSSDDIRKWIKAHESLYTDIEDLYLYFRMNDFRNLYLQFQFLLEDLDALPKVQEALATYNDFDCHEKTKWLDKYNRLAYCKVLAFDQLFAGINYEKRLIRFLNYSNIYFTGDDFFALIKFCKIYNCSKSEYTN